MLRPALSQLSIPAQASPAAMALAAVAALTAARLIRLAVQPAGLYPDEAQYWFWAQHPALGYYSKPPLVAWLIALTTAVVRRQRVRDPPVGAAAARRRGAGSSMRSERGSMTAGSGSGRRSPMLTAARGLAVGFPHLDRRGVAAVLGGGALRLHPGARAGRRRRWWVAVGIAAGLGLLAKYAMAYWLLSAFGFVLLVPGERRHLRPLLGAAAASRCCSICRICGGTGATGSSAICMSATTPTCRAVSLHPEALSRIPGLAIRGGRAAAFRRAAGDRGAPARFWQNRAPACSPSSRCRAWR